MLAEIDARQVPKTHLGWGSTAEWFTHLAGTHRSTGHRTVRQAGQLVDELPATHAALRAGRVSPEQAAVIADAIDRLPHKPDLRGRAEALLLDEATRLNATDLAKAAKHLLAVADPERADRDAEKELEKGDRAAHLGRYLSITEDGAGGVRVRGRGTVEDAATLQDRAAPAHRPGTGPGPGHRRGRRRPPRPRRPALGRPDHHRHPRPDHRPGPRHPRRPAPDHHHHRPRHPARTGSASPPHATPERRNGRSGGGADGCCAGDGRIDWLTLDGAIPVTDDGLTLTPGVVRRLACDADLIPVALGTRSEVLDVGRTHRLVTAPLWRALVCRDQHCAFPGCTRPPLMCHAHHIRHWLHGGKTKLANLVLLCGHHHRVIHHTPWEVRLNPDDGRPEFLPPPKPGDHHDWIRHRPRRE